MRFSTNTEFWQHLLCLTLWDYKPIIITTARVLSASHKPVHSVNYIIWFHFGLWVCEYIFDLRRVSLLIETFFSISPSLSHYSSAYTQTGTCNSSLVSHCYNLITHSTIHFQMFITSVHYRLSCQNRFIVYDSTVYILLHESSMETHLMPFIVPFIITQNSISEAVFIGSFHSVDVCTEHAFFYHSVCHWCEPYSIICIHKMIKQYCIMTWFSKSFPTRKWNKFSQLEYLLN